jgi:hypothetical protein
MRRAHSNGQIKSRIAEKAPGQEKVLNERALSSVSFIKRNAGDGFSEKEHILGSPQKW